MLLKPNKIRASLNEGKVVIGTCMTALSPNLVELAGFCGYEWCRIDTEHNFRQDTTVEYMVRSAIVSGISPIVRIDKDDPYLIRKVLEVGADGFIVPSIHNAEEVREVVNSAKFPPLGNRGYSSLCFSGGYGMIPGDQWLEWSNREPLVGVMIETQEASDNVEEIMAVEGLDFVLFGPADYSIAIGLGKPNKSHPKVEEALKRTIAAAKKHGKHVMFGIGVPWEEEAKKYIDMGVTMLEVGHDYSILGREWKNAFNQVIEVMS